MFFFSSCSPFQVETVPSPVPIEQPSFTSTEISEESLLATEQAMAGMVKTEVALTMAARPTFAPMPTLTSTLANLPTLTPIPNSTPVANGAYFDVSPDVLGPRYEIEDACYFDIQSGWERYEIYAGAIAESGDEYSAQGVAVVRILRVTEQLDQPYVELVDTKEYLTERKEGPLRLPSWGDCPNDWILLRTPLKFGWILSPISGEFYVDRHSIPLARMESAGKTQFSGIGSYCWNGSCADGGAIGTSPIPLVIQPSSIASLYLPLQEPPDKLGLRTMFILPSGVLQGDNSYDYVREDHAEWSYAKPGREIQELGALPLKREQEIKLPLEPGYYVLMIFAYWQDYGDVIYSFLIEV